MLPLQVSNVSVLEQATAFPL